MRTAAIKGKFRADAEILIHEFLAMATGKPNLNSPNHISQLAVCAILTWHTLYAGFNSVASTLSEADADPTHAPTGNA